MDMVRDQAVAEPGFHAVLHFFHDYRAQRLKLVVDNFMEGDPVMLWLLEVVNGLNSIQRIFDEVQPIATLMAAIVTLLDLFFILAIFMIRSWIFASVLFGLTSQWIVDYIDMAGFSDRFKIMKELIDSWHEVGYLFLHQHKHLLVNAHLTDCCRLVSLHQQALLSIILMLHEPIVGLSARERGVHQLFRVVIASRLG